MIAFIDAHKDQHGIEPMCKQLPITVTTYYAHKDRESDPDKESNRSIRDRHLKPEIQRVWDENLQVYGVMTSLQQLSVFSSELNNPQPYGFITDFYSSFSQ